jgi:hypothetical protein
MQRPVFKSSLVFLGFLLFLACFNVTFAQSEKGDNEILINGSYNIYASSSGEKTTWTTYINAIFNYGIFVTKSLEIGGGPAISYASTGLGSDASVAVNLNLFTRLYFPKEGSKTIFYIGVEGKLMNIFEDVSGPSASIFDRAYIKPLVGLKYYFVKNAAFDINAGYGFCLSAFGDGLIDGTFGVSIIF